MNKEKLEISLVKFQERELEAIWKQGFQEQRPQWKEWDGPYFDNDYRPYPTFEAFKASSDGKFYLNDRSRCIIKDGKPVGMVSMYWENEKTRWLNIGITIFDSNCWNGGIGTQALKLWVTEIFSTIHSLEHIGLVTWSGNQRMMRAAEKLGMKKEAQIRKVRFWKNQYYDSVSYGILREEWVEVEQLV